MMRVLIVEDDQWIADCYQAWLESDGMAVRHVRTAQEALDALDDTPPDVVLLDLLLPYANGIQLLHTMQSHHDSVDIPVIVCSSSLPKDTDSLKAYGAKRIVQKAALSPATLRTLVKEVTHHAAV